MSQLAPYTARDLTRSGTAGSVALVRRSADLRSFGASDGELARAIASAPPGAAQAEEAELYGRFARRVRLYGLKHLRDGAAAEDLAQEVLLVTIERLRAGEVRNPDEIGSFILGTSRMLTGSTERKTRRRETLTAQFHSPELYAEPAVESGDIAAVERCLHGLTERDRRVLVLTMRHLVFADDVWVGRMLRGGPSSFDPLGVPPTDTTDDAAAEMGLELTARPSFETVSDLHAERRARLTGLLARVTDVELPEVRTAVLAPDWGEESFTVLDCLTTVVREHVDHLRFARRDLAVLDTARGGSAPA